MKRARSDLATLRNRLTSLGGRIDNNAAADVAQIASLVCDCEVALVPGLSETRALTFLHTKYGVDVSSAGPTTDDTLAGVLCVTTNGMFRWILVRAEDALVRQRFTIAHELGHLIVEAEPELEKAAATVSPPSILTGADTELVLFSRCDVTDSVRDADAKASVNPFTEADLRELRAHHFAAELLMPYEGVQRLVAGIGGGKGIRTAQDRERVVSAIARQYDVSVGAARRRVEKDLAIVPIDADPNGDLFA